MRSAATAADAQRARVDARLAEILPRYAVAIAGAEFVFAFLDPLLGIVLYAGILIVALTQYASRPTSPGRGILPALALVPLLRIQSLVMPIEDVPRILWYVLAGVPVLLAIALTARALQLSPGSLGLRLPQTPWPDLMAAASGIPLGLIAYRVSLGAQPIVDAGDLIVTVTVLVIFVAFLEELLFRGLLQRLAADISTPAGPVIVTIIYATLFISSYSITLIALMATAGAIFAWAVHRGSSLIGVTIGHGLILMGGIVAPALTR
jgi:uncharacterized protein